MAEVENIPPAKPVWPAPAGGEQKERGSTTPGNEGRGNPNTDKESKTSPDKHDHTQSNNGVDIYV